MNKIRRKELNKKKNKLIEELNNIQIKEEVLRRKLRKINDEFVEDLLKRSKEE